MCTLDEKIFEWANVMANKKLSKYETHCDTHGQYVEADHNGYCVKCLDDERAIRKQQQRIFERLNLLNEAGVGIRYHTADLNNVKTTQQKVANALSDYKFDRNIALIGTTGTGKTYLATALINSVIDTKTCLLVKFYNLADIKINEASKFNRMLNVDFLLIDDFGTNANDFAYSVANEIYDKRYENRLPTMLTSNLTAEQLERMPDPLYSRIKCSCLSLVLSGDDYRMGGGLI